MTTYESREAWGALPPKSNPGPFVALEATVMHYTANSHGYAVEEGEDHERCRDQVRGIQEYHQGIPDQSDIEYSHLGCNHGVVFQGRATGIKTGANGSAQTNKTMPSFCMLMGVGDEPSQALYDAAAWWHWQIEQRASHTLTMNGHRDIYSTSCPGDVIYPWVRDGVYHDYQSPSPPVHPPTPGDDMARVGPYLIQATGKDGTPAGRVYATDGNFMTIRWLETDEALAGYRWTMTHYGVVAPELAPDGRIEPIDTIAAYGVVIT